MLLDADDCQLVLIDYQARLMPAIHDAPAVLANARRLAQMARLMQVPVWATEQYPEKLGGTDESLAALCDRIVPKMAFSGAEELQPLLAPPVAAPRGNVRSLPKHLRAPAAAEPARGTVVIAGCEAYVCLRPADRRGLRAGDDRDGRLRMAARLRAPALQGAASAGQVTRWRQGMIMNHFVPWPAWSLCHKLSLI